MTFLRKAGNFLAISILPVLAVTGVTALVIEKPLGDPRHLWPGPTPAAAGDPVISGSQPRPPSTITVTVPAPPKTTIPGYAPGTWEETAAKYILRNLRAPVVPRVKHQRRIIMARDESLQPTGK